MKEKIKALKEELNNVNIQDPEGLKNFCARFIGSKSVFPPLFAELVKLSQTDKKQWGPKIQELKQQAQEILKNYNESLKNKDPRFLAPTDLSLPASTQPLGGRHPLSLVQREMEKIFLKNGFSIKNGSEIETDEHNFTALNFPTDHPARDSQDTFFLSKDKNYLLRTHTSATQVRLLKKYSPPFKYIIPGRVYRNETVTSRAHCFFHQIEGINIGEGISFAHLKYVLLRFAQAFFGSKTKIRLRPSYFPFTEPSAELDISCLLCQEKGCSICKKTGWVEVGGCGMIHPRVLAQVQNASKDKTKYTGYAFGLGIERMTMLRYQIHDLRIFSANDIRFLSQFSTVHI
ncbi:MAG: phenylalanine--tRNA ligase subunit alpha [Cytophagales bacterium]|nr:phenylalanine--tRNA ligase subunit alpha [Cytophagales bacterium]